MRQATVLIVEDDTILGPMLVKIATQQGYQARAVTTIEAARGEVAAGDIEVLITDLQLPDGDGMKLVAYTRAADPRIAIVVITGFGSVPLAVQAIRQGAYDFLTKPIQPAALVVAIDRAIEARSLRGEVERLRRELSAQRGEPMIIGSSRAMLDVVALVDRVADSDATVLITGPSGCGKELVARSLHVKSRRQERPLVAVNAAAIPDNLLESELFGYVKGAFTDARSDKRGLFQEAEGGTLFLDEIGDLPLGLQAKLLRVLQEREVRPLGATRNIPIDVRVVAATHRDLRRAVSEGRFRSDLFYRLAVIEIAVPTLRDRPEDILPLAEHFLKRVAARAGRPIQGFSAAAAKRLVSYAWPGNVRELENAVERAVALAREEWISPDDLPPTLVPDARIDLFASGAERLMTLEELEHGYVGHVLERCGGNKKRAAALLGISRRTIQRWLGENGADEDES